MHLLECMVDPTSVGKLDLEFLDDLFEVRNRAN